MRFNKPSQSTRELYQHLENKGLEFGNEHYANETLRDIGYYRIKGYLPSFYQGPLRKFLPNSKYEAVLEIYYFDKSLRLIIMNALESFEVTIRSLLFNGMAEIHGSHWFENPSHFNLPPIHSKFLDSVNEYIQGASESFIKNYRAKYTSPTLPPSWMVSEVITFGKLSSLYENLVDNQIKKDVAARFNTLPVFLESWLKSMNFLRNVCAHHGRLWNRPLPLKPKLPTRQKHRFLNHVEDETNQKLYGILSCMVYMGTHFSAHFTLKEDLKALFKLYPQIPVAAMGFPADWKSEPIWQ